MIYSAAAEVLTLRGMNFLPLHCLCCCAADVVYDPEIVGSLVKLLSNVLKCSSPDVIICSTVRNEETYGGFKQQLGSRCY